MTLPENLEVLTLGECDWDTTPIAGAIDLSGIFNGFQWISWEMIPSGNLLHSELERSTIFNWNIHYFYGHFQ